MPPISGLLFRARSRRAGRLFFPEDAQRPLVEPLGIEADQPPYVCLAALCRHGSVMADVVSELSCLLAQLSCVVPPNLAVAGIQGLGYLGQGLRLAPAATGEQVLEGSQRELLLFPFRKRSRSLCV